MFSLYVEAGSLSEWIMTYEERDSASEGVMSSPPIREHEW